MISIGATPEQQSLNDEARRREARLGLSLLSMHSPLPSMRSEEDEMPDYQRGFISRQASLFGSAKSLQFAHSGLSSSKSSSKSVLAATPVISTKGTDHAATAKTVGMIASHQPPPLDGVSPSLYTGQAQPRDPASNGDGGLGGDNFDLDDENMPKQLIRSRLMPLRRIIGFILGVACTSWPVGLLGARAPAPKYAHTRIATLRD